MLAGAVSLVVVALGISGARYALASVQSQLTEAGMQAVESGRKVAVYGIFLMAVFFAVRAVLEI